MVMAYGAQSRPLVTFPPSGHRVAYDREVPFELRVQVRLPSYRPRPTDCVVLEAFVGCSLGVV